MDVSPRLMRWLNILLTSIFFYFMYAGLFTALTENTLSGLEPLITLFFFNVALNYIKWGAISWNKWKMVLTLCLFTYVALVATAVFLIVAYDIYFVLIMCVMWYLVPGVFMKLNTERIVNDRCRLDISNHTWYLVLIWPKVLYDSYWSEVDE